VRGLLDIVENVIELGRQGVDVLPVKRRDEAAVESLDNPAHYFIAGVFFHFQLIAAGP